MSFLPLIYLRTTDDFKYLRSYLITEANCLQKQSFTIKQDDQESWVMNCFEVSKKGFN
jgi:hypothetical protein